MKCRSVACVWSGSPPPQRVTATAVLRSPPTLYTGGSDGAIFWWSLSGTDSGQEIKPLAMLCGHAAAIADLGICYPTVASGNGNVDSFNNVEMNSTSADCGALISACTDGVLCVWSRGSGHCRRRRKMPPWVGSPSMIRALPSNPRYVCLACCFVDAVHLFDRHSVDRVEGVEASVDDESQCKRPSKCTFVIVDTYSLAVVQTVFHGNLSIGPLKFISVFSSAEDREKQSAVMVDSFGKIQLVPIPKDFSVDVEGGADVLRSSSHSEMTIWADGLSEWGKIVSVSTREQIFALVYKTGCIFRLVDSGIKIGEISFSDNSLCLKGSSTQSHVVGGMFLEGGVPRNMPSNPETKNFVVWNNRGYGVVYKISYLEDIFKFEPIYEIPSVSYSLDARLSVCFTKLNSLLLRVESVCFQVKEPFLWRPRVTIWSLYQQADGCGEFCQQCKMLGEGSFLDDWAVNSTPLHRIKDSEYKVGTEASGEIDLVSREDCVPDFENVNNICAHNERYFLLNSQIVSSSMVISENFQTPYAIVYGFYSGEIEVVRFDMFFPRLDSCGESPRIEVDSDASKQCFSGHTGAILCLAAHQMVGMSKGQSFNKVLVSGSMDCTVRVWDLDTGHLITVMHQHVAPVRQIILPPPQTEHPWSDCFLSVGEDSCVALASLETLRVERMFPGHPNYPAKVVWDGVRGYVACLSRNHSGTSDPIDVLYIWDVKTGARERVLRGIASHSMFDHFCRSIGINPVTGSILNGNTSASSFLLPIIEDAVSKHVEKGTTSLNTVLSMSNTTELNSSQAHAKGNSARQRTSRPLVPQRNTHPIKCSCPFPGVASLSFNLESLMSFFRKCEFLGGSANKQKNALEKEHGTGSPSSHSTAMDNNSDPHGTLTDNIEEHDWVRSLEECLLRYSLSLLHLWNIDFELDNLLIADMKLKRPDKFIVASGLQGDRGSLTLMFPGLTTTLELWKSSSEFCALRSLTMVSLAQRMLSLFQSSSAASSALAAFYTRHFAEKIPDIKPPLLQLLVSFWQDESEHVRMAARSLFHCAASRAIPLPLCSQKAFEHVKFMSSTNGMGENEDNRNKDKSSVNMLDSVVTSESLGISQIEESKILSWLESFEVQEWVSSVGGSSQDAMTSHIIVAAALAIWYPSLVKPSVSMLVVHPLMKLVMAMNEKYSCTAAELLAEGIEGTWKPCIGSEIPRLIGDIFFQIECVSGAPNNLSPLHSPASDTIRETLIGILLPSLAMTDIPAFLNVIESQIWSTASDSPVHLVSLMTLIRVVRGCPRNLAQYLDKVVNFILQTMDPGNSVLRRICLQSAMTVLREVIRVFPMVALNDSSTRLAAGDAIAEIKNATIRVYDMQSVMKVKVLDASGPPGLPSLLQGASEALMITAISALSFSPDGEGLVAFSEQGLMIRWWSLGSVWWEKLSRNFVPAQCTKLIFVPPWEGFSPTTSRSSIMANVMGCDRQTTQEKMNDLSDLDNLKLLIHNLDLSYRLEWVGERKVLLTKHSQELGTFQL